MSDLPQIRLQPRQNHEALCGFCRDTFVPDEEVRSCEGCEAPFHLECWRDELQEQCTTLGCNNEKPARGPRRFHALRARLRRRRRRRLLDGGMAESGTTQSRVFLAGAAIVLLTGIMWAISALGFEFTTPDTFFGIVLGLATVSVLAAAGIALIRKRSERD